METGDKKRTRSSNWIDKEKNLLWRLVMGKIDIIENKDTSTKTNVKKKEAWKEILSCFNALNRDCKDRDLIQLQNQWRSTKNILKKTKRAELAEGGTIKSLTPEEIIVEAVPHAYTDDSNMFDSSGICEHDNLTPHYNEENKLMDLGDVISKKESRPEESDFYNPHQCGSISANMSAPEATRRKFHRINTFHRRKLMESDFYCPHQCGSISANMSAPEATKRKFHRINTFPRRKLMSGDVDYKKNIFEIIEKRKEKVDARAEERHKLKMDILHLQKEYWRRKLQSTLK